MRIGRLREKTSRQSENSSTRGVSFLDGAPGGAAGPSSFVLPDATIKYIEKERGVRLTNGAETEADQKMGGPSRNLTPQSSSIAVLSHRFERVQFFFLCIGTTRVLRDQLISLQPRR